MKAIERIREQTEAVRKEHAAILARDKSRTRCDDCGSAWPCEAVRFAEDRLKLAEALAETSCECQPGGHHRPDNEECQATIAARVLDEVAR